MKGDIIHMDTPPMNRVEVIINGQVFTLTSNEADESQMHRVALYVDRKLKEIKSIRPLIPMGENTQAMQAAVHIAEDLLKTQKLLNQMEEENRSLKRQLAKAQQGLEEYIDTLDAQLHDQIQPDLPPNVVSINPRTAAR